MIALLAMILIADPEMLELPVDGVARKAIVYAPGKEGAPLVFGFHGHGGTAGQAARSFRIHEEWPEAVVVYLQGLPTPGKLSDPEGKKNGWQSVAGDQDDRDLKFFDAVLAAMKAKHKIDETRIYAMGHSNGGQFSYLLWGCRPGLFAAIAPSGSAGTRNMKETKPVPVFHVMGEKDPLVKPEWQRAALAQIREFNGCEATGKDWDKGCTIYASSKDAPVVTFIHPGGHQYPAEAPALIVKFLKEAQLKK